MEFIIVGGGCYGHFYVRQLLRGAERIGLTRLTVVDRDPQCRVAREFSDPRLQLVVREWRDFLFPYFRELVARAEQSGAVTAHYVPPCLAPHILFELFEAALQAEAPGIRLAHQPMTEAVGTPFDTPLASGHRAVSFATWLCPHSCIEPQLCPATRGPRDWEMRDRLTALQAEGRLRVASLHLFQCRHFAMGVGTIPFAEIVAEYQRFRAVAQRPEPQRIALATISSCHGLIGLVESQAA